MFNSNSTNHEDEGREVILDEIEFETHSGDKGKRKRCLPSLAWQSSGGKRSKNSFSEDGPGTSNSPFPYHPSFTLHFEPFDTADNADAKIQDKER